MLQPHEGSSETPAHRPALRGGRSLQPHEGSSETCGVDCSFDGVVGFNPTRVRLKHRIEETWTGDRWRFNPTRVRLKPLEAPREADSD